jgi:hypothetical protein
MVTKNYFADSENFSLSNVKILLRKDLTDVDSGAKVDYDLTKKAADGTTDYSGLYDFNKINKCINEFYDIKTDDSSSKDNSSHKEDSSRSDSSKNDSSKNDSSKNDSSKTETSQTNSSQPQSSQSSYDGPPQTGYAGAAVSVTVVIIFVAALAVIRKKQD